MSFVLLFSRELQDVNVMRCSRIVSSDFLHIFESSETDAINTMIPKNGMPENNQITSNRFWSSEDRQT
jgi:hypothetical protein